MPRWTAVALWLHIIFLPVVIVQAHGGGQLIAGPTPAGPYTASVWVNPPQPRAAETLHFTVGLADPLDKSPVLDAQIMVTMQPLTGNVDPVVSAVTTDQSVNRLFYETDLEVYEPGPYLATFDIQGQDGDGQLTVELDVSSSSGVNWFLIGIGGLAVVIVLRWWQTRRTAGALADSNG